MKIKLKVGDKHVVKVVGEDAGEVQSDWVAVPRSLMQRAAHQLQHAASRSPTERAAKKAAQVAATLRSWLEGFN